MGLNITPPRVRRVRNSPLYIASESIVLALCCSPHTHVISLSDHVVVAMAKKKYPMYPNEGPMRSVARVAKAAIVGAAKTYATNRIQRFAQGPAPLTGQFDYKTDYSKRKKSKKQRKRNWKKRKWSRSVIKVVRNANVGTTHLVKNSKGTLTSSAGSSNSVAYGLNGLNGTALDTFNTCNDIAEFIKEKDAAIWDNFNSTAATYYQQLHLS